MKNKPNILYTIGHSTHSIEELIRLLNGHAVNAVCDVRSSPYSQYNPQFNRESLQKALKASGISYVFLGDELGARPDDPACYMDGKVRFECVAGTDRFRDGIERLRIGPSNTGDVSLTNCLPRIASPVQKTNTPCCD
jgi:uncharacterized protein (DUF488 family)